MKGTASATTLGELADAVKQNLHQKGVIQKIQGTLRAHIFTALQEHKSSSRNVDASEQTLVDAPTIPSETLIINEMIAEYLHFHGHETTAAVFASESLSSGKPGGLIHDRGLSWQLRRDIIKKKLGVCEQQNSRNDSNASSPPPPLLYDIVEIAKESDRLNCYDQS
mmetsp:Transcript_2331/g.3039  ORF Transcript_2331/g.3039 Transcript_2331/m.3039 type:complete len:166 (-) Transcript_2331:116-613(-)|eukprot:CAMPEP_0172507740 /NCGR_PEP_ID=MMETSP1066-20121228/206135_1 /TAXON_ID=671091 /ORGANISM="Coscinodiscus wailesii, Strain CCMP2513" /LENGTH=165 /DNA_ID=CAMNT_0013285399 /DNA_START=109 /DNA_END=606 /DNA_ORIENTATION=+